MGKLAWGQRVQVLENSLHGSLYVYRKFDFLYIARARLKIYLSIKWACRPGILRNQLSKAQ